MKLELPMSKKPCSTWYKWQILLLLLTAPFIFLNAHTSTKLHAISGTADISVHYEFEAAQITETTTPWPSIGELSYKLFVTNDGPDEATNLEIALVYHDEVVPQNRTFTIGYYESSKRAWIIPSLPAGNTAEMVETSKMYVPADNKWAYAFLSAVDQDDPDSSTGNSNEQEDDTDRLIMLAPSSDLDLTLSTPILEYERYQHIPYEVVVQNLGPSIATEVTVHFPLPSGMVFSNSSATKGEYDLFYKTWNIGNLDIGQSVLLNLTLFTNNDDGGKVAYAQVQTSRWNDPDSNPGNGTPPTVNEDDEAAVTIIPLGSGATVDLELSLENNSPEIYYDNGPMTVRVKNKGAIDATNVSVKINSNANSVYINGTVASQGNIDFPIHNVFDGGGWDVGDIPAGGEATLELDLYRVDQYHVAYFFAQVEAVDQDDPDSAPGNDLMEPFNPDEDDEDQLIMLGFGGPPADLELSKVANVNSADIGDEVIFTITLENNGVYPSPICSIKDLLPAGVDYQSANATFGNYDPNTGIWELGYISNANYPNAPNDLITEATLNIVTTVSDISAPIINFAQIETGYDIDATPGNDIDNVVDEDDEAEAVVYPGCTGDVVLNTQAQVDAFNCFSVVGDLTISGSDITNLDALQILTYVGGALEIKGNSNLVDLNGISALHSVGGFLNIGQNGKLVNINAFNALTNIGGYFRVIQNPKLDNLNGFSGLTQIGGDLTLLENWKLTQIDGLIGITSIPGHLNIDSNFQLDNLDGFSNLLNVDGRITFYSNNNLIYCCGLFPLFSSGHVGGDVTFIGNPSFCSSIDEILNSCGGTVDYCESFGDYPWHEWISKVELNTLINVSGKSQYSNFTQLSTTLEIDNSYPINLATSFSYYAYDEYWRVWIDFNQNGSFADAGEMVVDEKLNAPANGTENASINSSISIPGSVMNGATRMRVSMKRGSAPEPCEVLPFGEVEDYSVNIIGGSSSNLALDCPDDVYLNIAAGNSGSNADWDIPTYSSTCTNGTVTLTQTGGQPIGSFFPIGVYEIEYTATDDCGNFIECSFYLIVEELSDYCESYGDFPWHEWISQVEIFGINNNSGKSKFSDFTDFQTDNLQPGNDYGLVLEASYSYTTYDEYWKVWVDFNQDDIFDPVNELVLSEIMSRPPNDSGSKQLHETIHIPVDAMVGPARMRVSMSRNAFAGPCEIFGYGEVEDYTLVIDDDSSLLPKQTLTSLLVFPNPARDQVFVQLNDNIDKSLELQIFDVYGKLMYKEIIDEVPETPIPIELNAFENGLYFISARVGQQKIITNKFIIEDLK